MAGPINLGQAFSNGQGDGFCLACWTHAQDRLGEVLHSLGRECASTFLLLLLPSRLLPAGFGASPFFRVKDASSWGWSSWLSLAPGSSQQDHCSLAPLILAQKLFPGSWWQGGVYCSYTSTESASPSPHLGLEGPSSMAAEQPSCAQLFLVSPQLHAVACRHLGQTASSCVQQRCKSLLQCARPPPGPPGTS